MRKQSIIVLLAVCLASVSVSVMLRRCENRSGRGVMTSDTITHTDTIPYYLPVPRDSVVVRYVVEKLPVVMEDTTGHTKSGGNYAHNPPGIIPDSMDVVIPIEQKEYEDSAYHLWVSGYKVRLDSIMVYRQRQLITNTILKGSDKRWYIGLTAGYGIGRNGLTPYVGVGVTYRLFSLGK